MYFLRVFLYRFNSEIILSHDPTRDVVEKNYFDLINLNFASLGFIKNILSKKIILNSYKSNVK